MKWHDDIIEVLCRRDYLFLVMISIPVQKEAALSACHIGRWRMRHRRGVGMRIVSHRLQHHGGRRVKYENNF